MAIFSRHISLSDVLRSEDRRGLDVLQGSDSVLGIGGQNKNAGKCLVNSAANAKNISSPAWGDGEEGNNWADMNRGIVPCGVQKFAKTALPERNMVFATRVPDREKGNSNEPSGSQDEEEEEDRSRNDPMACGLENDYHDVEPLLEKERHVYR